MVYKKRKTWYNIQYMCQLGVIAMQIIKFEVGDLVELKKQHPCGERKFKIIRLGSDVRIVCQGCGRDMTIDRIKLEKSTKNVIKN